MADGVQQVGLPQARVAVDEQRVVGLGRRLGDRDRCGVREAVAAPDDERLEGVLRVQPGGDRARRLLLLVRGLCLLLPLSLRLVLVEVKLLRLARGRLGRQRELFGRQVVEALGIAVGLVPQVLVRVVLRLWITRCLRGRFGLLRLLCPGRAVVLRSRA